MERPMQKLNDLSRSLTALEPNGTLIAVIEMSLSSWLVAGIVPGVERQPLKKLAVDESALLKLLHRWREEAEKAGRRIKRIVVAFEAGRDGFWLGHLAAGAFAEFERSMIRERVNAGLKRAVANGKVLGRRPVEDNPEGAAKARKARKLLAAGTGINRVAKAVGLSNG